MPALRSLVEKLSPIEVAKGDAHHPARRCARRDVHSRERTGARFPFRQWHAAQSRLLSRGRFLRRTFDPKRLAPRRVGRGLQRLSSARARTGSGPRPEAPLSGIRQADGGTARAISGERRKRVCRSISRPRCCPPKSRAHDKIGVDDEPPPQPSEPVESEDPFAEENGLFRKSEKAHPQDRTHRADRRNGLRRRQSRHDLPSLRSQGQSLAHSPALSHLDRRDELEGDLPRRHRARAWPRARSKVSLRNLPLMPLPAIIHWEGNHWMVLLRRGRDLRQGGRSRAWFAQDSAQGIRAELVGLRRAFRLHRPRSRSAPESKPGLAWILPFLTKFTTLFLQVMLLAVAITFLELLFPVFTEMVVDKVIVEKRHQPAQNHSPRDGRGALFRSGGVARAGISALVRRRSPRHCDPRFPEPANVVAADELFHQPPHRRHSAPARWRAPSAAICRAARHRRAPCAGPARRRDLAHGALQPDAHARFPRDHCRSTAG